MVIEKFPVPNFSLFLESGFIEDLEFLEKICIIIFNFSFGSTI